MARTSRRRPAATRRRRPATTTRSTPPRQTPAEIALLDLARELAGLAASQREPSGALGAALERLGSAFAAGSALVPALHRARAAARRDKATGLALAWAFEQVRLGLADVLDTLRRSGAPIPGPPAVLSWLLVAACEALAHEAPAAAADRLGVFEAWLGGAVVDTPGTGR